MTDAEMLSQIDEIYNQHMSDGKKFDLHRYDALGDILKLEVIDTGSIYKINQIKSTWGILSTRNINCKLCLQRMNTRFIAALAAYITICEEDN